MKERGSFFSLRSAVALCALVTAGGLAGMAVSAAAQGQSDDPEIAFNDHCRQCHSVAKGDNRLGPSLYGVVGRKAGSVPKFAYSESLQNSGVTWDEKTLNSWITNPNAVVPGNNMGALFPGLKDADARAKIIAFLKSDTQKKQGS